MTKILFVTHENIDNTPVSKSMFADIAKKLNSEEGIQAILFSAGHSNTVYPLGYKFKRNTQGKCDWNSLKAIISSYKVFFKAAKDVEIVFFRSYPSLIIFFPLVKISRKYIIFDTRGLFFDELVSSGKIHKRWLMLFRIIEKILLKISDQIIAVTNSQSLFYQNKHGIKSAKITVVPNGAKNIRLYEDLSGSKRISFCYVGSLVKWHMPSLVRDFCYELETRGINFSLDIITKDIEHAFNTFSGLKNIKIFTHNYREKPIKYDYGFCFIDGGLSKKVCYPVKFNEYVVSGTHVLALDTVDEVNRLISKYNIGTLLKKKNTKDMVDEFFLKKRNFDYSAESLPYELSFDYQYECLYKIIDNYIVNN